MTKYKYFSFVYFIFSCVIAINLNGCTSLSKLLGLGFKKPQTELDSVKLEGISYGAVKLFIVLNVKNDNSYDLKIKKLTYKILVNDDLILDGSIEKLFLIKAKEINQISFPLEIPSASAIKFLNLLFSQNNQEKTVNIKGKIFISTALGTIELSYNHTNPLKI